MNEWKTEWNRNILAFWTWVSGLFWTPQWEWIPIRIRHWSPLLALMLLSLACGGEPEKEPIHVTIQPRQAVVTASGGTFSRHDRTHFHVEMEGTDNAQVYWNLAGGDMAGMLKTKTSSNIDEQVIYQAPHRPGTYWLKAQSVADPSVTDTIPIRVVPAPRIQRFSVSESPVKAGTGVYMLAQFTGGEASIEPNVGVATSSKPLLVFPTTTTTYTLTVRNPAGDEALATVTVHVNGPQGNS